MKITAPFTVTAVGDIISPQPVARSDPRFAGFADRMRAADVGFANMESSIVDLNHFPHAVTGTAAPRTLGPALRDMGITMMARANNHTFDCGPLGMFETDAALDAVGITHAGTGPSLESARHAAFRETPKGRVGLVSFYSVADTGHFGPTYQRTLATASYGNLGGNPGVNPLRLTAYNEVSREALDQLAKIAEASYGPRKGAFVEAAGERPARLRFYDQWYQAGPEPGAIRYDMEDSDRRGILDAIRNGKIYSDFMIATIHSHQSASFDVEGQFGTVPGLKEPLEHGAPDFLRQIAHEAIENGADMFLSHGVHALGGIEIYRGKPICYGLSNFIFQCGLQVGAGPDVLKNWAKKAELQHPDCHVAVQVEAKFDAAKLVALRLYPADLGGGRRPLSQMGIPLEPDRDMADAILRNIADYSRPFGTEIEIKDGVGSVAIS